MILGGGFQLALGADTRFVTPNAKLALMEIKWGLVPDMGATLLMASLAREDIIQDLGYTGRIFDSNDALAYGFATRLCDGPHTQALTYARDIANKNPEATRALRLSHSTWVQRDIIATDDKNQQAKLLFYRNSMRAGTSDLG